MNINSTRELIAIFISHSGILKLKYLCFTSAAAIDDIYFNAPDFADGNYLSLDQTQVQAIYAGYS